MSRERSTIDGVQVGIDFKFSVRFEVPVPSKLWLKWKGRKMEGWTSRRTYWGGRYGMNQLQGYTVFSCKDRRFMDAMTPEKMAEIATMLNLLRNTK